MELKIVYFKNPGKQNTVEVLRIARQRAKELGIKTLVVASTTGDTAVKAMEVFSGFRVIVLTHVTGYVQPNVLEFTEQNRKVVESKGGIIHTATTAFGGLSRAMRIQFGMSVPEYGSIVANTLRFFGHGMKVTCEMAMMAADAGLVRTDEDIIAIAGTSRGADTAIVLTPVNTHKFMDLKVKEILCKPHF